MADVTVGKFADIEDGGHKIFATHGEEIGVFRVGDKVFAWINHCPHAGGPVCQGKIFGKIDEALDKEKRSLGLVYSGRKNIVCPWHAYEFDVETGIHAGESNVRLKGVPVAVKNGDIVLTVKGRQ